MNKNSENKKSKHNNTSVKNEGAKFNNIKNANSLQGKGEKMISSDFVANYKNSIKNRSLLTEIASFCENGNNGKDEKLVYFAIEGKWRLVGPGVFRK